MAKGIGDGEGNRETAMKLMASGIGNQRREAVMKLMASGIGSQRKVWR